MEKQMVKRYSEAFKRQVVSEYEAGQSLSALQRKYGIKGNATIPAWVKKYAHAGLRYELVRIQRADEHAQVKELEAKINRLEEALSQTVVEKIALAAELAEAERLLAAQGKKKTAPSTSNDASGTR